MANQWFRMYAELATDPKVQVLSEALQRRYVMALCLHCNAQYENAPDDEIALALRITESEWRDTKEVLVARRLLCPDGSIAGWDNRQYISDLSDSTAAKRQQRYRDRKRNERNGNVTSRPPEADTDTDKSIEAIASVPEVTGTIEGGDSPKQEIPKCPADDIVALYHELMPLNPTVKVLSDARRKTIRARWKEASMLTCEPFGYDSRADGLKAWRLFFEVCSESAFLTGKAPTQPGRPPFVADIDFLMSPSGFAKCLENKYHRDVQ